MNLGRNFGKDFLASIVVFLVALPLCMGIAIASGVPPALGLITGIIGGLVVGVLAGSPLQVSGPAAGLAVIVWDLVQQHGIEMLGPLVLMAGLIQLAAGVLRWGQYFRAVAPPVIYGMLAGIGVLIFAGQFHVMVDDKPRGSGLANLLSLEDSIEKGVTASGGEVHRMAALIGLATIISIVVWARFAPKKLKFVPAPLVGVVVGTTTAWAWSMPVRRVDVPSNLLDAAVWPTAATLGRLANVDMLLAAGALALIASAETLLCAIAVDRLHTGPRTQFNRELGAQGIGNMICGVFGALPMTGVIVRSSANIQAGGQTRISAILHGAWLLALVVVLPQALRQIPMSTLAAVLVFTGYKLVNIDNIRALAKFGRVPVLIYFATLIGIVVTDLLTGVFIGVGLSIARLVYSVVHLSAKLKVNEGGTRADLYLEGSATFLSLPRLATMLDNVPAKAELHVHIEHLQHIDHACLDALYHWEKQNAPQGASLIVQWDDLIARYQRVVPGGAPGAAAASASGSVANSAGQPAIRS
jgi:MFS superfamily sulfate permease-like transporter